MKNKFIWMYLIFTIITITLFTISGVYSLKTLMMISGSMLFVSSGIMCWLLMRLEEKNNLSNVEIPNLEKGDEDGKI